MSKDHSSETKYHRNRQNRNENVRTGGPKKNFSKVVIINSKEKSKNKNTNNGRTDTDNFSIAQLCENVESEQRGLKKVSNLDAVSNENSNSNGNGNRSNFVSHSKHFNSRFGDEAENGRGRTRERERNYQKNGAHNVNSSQHGQKDETKKEDGFYPPNENKKDAKSEVNGFHKNRGQEKSRGNQNRRNNTRGKKPKSTLKSQETETEKGDGVHVWQVCSSSNGETGDGRRAYRNKNAKHARGNAFVVDTFFPPEDKDEGRVNTRRDNSGKTLPYNLNRDDGGARKVREKDECDFPWFQPQSGFNQTRDGLKVKEASKNAQSHPEKDFDIQLRSMPLTKKKDVIYDGVDENVNDMNTKELRNHQFIQKQHVFEPAASTDFTPAYNNNHNYRQNLYMTTQQSVPLNMDRLSLHNYPINHPQVQQTKIFTHPHMLQHKEDNFRIDNMYQTDNFESGQCSNGNYDGIKSKMNQQTFMQREMSNKEYKDLIENNLLCDRSELEHQPQKVQNHHEMKTIPDPCNFPIESYKFDNFSSYTNDVNPSIQLEFSGNNIKPKILTNNDTCLNINKRSRGGHYEMGQPNTVNFNSQECNERLMDTCLDASKKFETKKEISSKQFHVPSIVHTNPNYYYKQTNVKILGSKSFPEKEATVEKPSCTREVIFESDKCGKDVNKWQTRRNSESGSVKRKIWTNSKLKSTETVILKHKGTSPIIASPVSTCKTDISEIITNFAALETQLRQALEYKDWNINTWNHLESTREKFKNLANDMLTQHINYSNVSNCDQTVWKYGFHKVFELISGYKNNTNFLTDKVSIVADDGINFYSSLIEQLQEKFSIDVDVLLKSEFDGTFTQEEKFASMSIQQSYLYLGDLYRYKAIQDACFYQDSFVMYMNAVKIERRNGVCYQRLSVLMGHQKKIFEAIYYDIRVINTKNPIYDTLEHVRMLLNGIYNRYQEIEKIKGSRIDKAKKNISNMHDSRARKEIWVRKDGSCVTKEDLNADTDDSLSLSEMYFKFNLTFLILHGCMIDSVDVNLIPQTSLDCLSTFSQMVEKFSNFRNRINQEYLFKLLIFNIFTITHIVEKCNKPGGSFGALPEQRDVAVAFGMNFFALLCKWGCSMLSEPEGWFHKDLNVCLSAIHIWAQWMDCHKNVWNIKISSNEVIGGNAWKNICDFFNHVNKFADAFFKFSSRKTETSNLLVIPEEVFFMGFTPLESFKRKIVYVDASKNQQVALLHYRVLSLKCFASLVAEMKDSQMKLENLLYVPTQVEILQVLEPSVKIPQVKKSVWEDKNFSSNTNNIVTRKKSLKPEVFRSNLTRMEIRVTPEILVLDTNCFIGFFMEINKMVWNRQYSIVIPLVVVNELDMLASGKRMNNYALEEHAIAVKDNAKKSVRFIEDELENKNPSLRVINVKGKPVLGVNIHQHEAYIEEKISNDEKILKCCTTFVNDLPSKYIKKVKGAPIRLDRSCVLLTDDRNLRLLAHVINIPVKSLPEFLKWNEG